MTEEIPNPYPSYLNCQCSQCNTWIHRQPAVIRKQKLIFCGDSCRNQWHEEHPEARKQWCRSGQRHGVKLKMGGIVYG